MGLERLTMTILGIKNIREASLFPSDPKRIAGNRIKARIFFGGENIRNEIVRLFKDQDVTYNHTIDAGEAVGVKALILRGKNSKKNYQFNIPAQMKLDMKAVAERVGEKCEFEQPEVILERFGITINGIPPFGQLLNLDTYYDERILNGDRLVFSCGLPNETMSVNPSHLVKVVQPLMGQFAKE